MIEGFYQMVSLTLIIPCQIRIHILDPLISLPFWGTGT
jgi:hypothetical protein